MRTPRDDCNLSARSGDLSSSCQVDGADTLLSKGRIYQLYAARIAQQRLMQQSKFQRPHVLRDEEAERESQAPSADVASHAPISAASSAVSETPCRDVFDHSDNKAQLHEPTQVRCSDHMDFVAVGQLRPLNILSVDGHGDAQELLERAAALIDLGRKLHGEDEPPTHVVLEHSDHGRITFSPLSGDRLLFVREKL